MPNRLKLIIEYCISVVLETENGAVASVSLDKIIAYD